MNKLVATFKKIAVAAVAFGTAALSATTVHAGGFDGKPLATNDWFDVGFTNDDVGQLTGTTGIPTGKGSWTHIPSGGAEVVSDSGYCLIIDTDGNDPLTLTPAALPNTVSNETISVEVLATPSTDELEDPTGSPISAFALRDDGSAITPVAYVAGGWTNLVYSPGAEHLTNAWFTLYTDFATVGDTKYLRFSIKPANGTPTILEDSTGETWFRAATNATNISSVSLTGSTSCRTISGDSIAYAVASANGTNYATFAEAITAAEAYYTTNGSYPTITVLNGATEQDNPDWTIDNGNLVHKPYVAAVIASDGVTTNDTYTTIQAAIAAAQAGETVAIFAGTYDLGNTPITVNESITITGEGKGATTLNFTASGKAALSLAANNVTIRDMKITQPSADNTYIISVPRGGSQNNYSIAYTNVTMQALDLVGGKYAINVTGDSFAIKDCDLSGQTGSAQIEIYSYSGDSIISNCTFIGDGDNDHYNIMHQGGNDGSNLEGIYSSGTLKICDNTGKDIGVFYLFNQWGMVDTTEKMNLIMTGNFITNTTNKGVNFYNGGDNSSLAALFNEITITNNAFFVKGATGAVRPVIRRDDGVTTGLTIDANYNYWGSADPDFSQLAKTDNGVTPVNIDCAYWYNSYDTETGVLSDLRPLPSVAEIVGGSQYSTLQAAVDAAYEMTGDVTIKLVTDAAEKVNITQKAGLSLTINGDGKTLTGQLRVTDDSANDTLRTGALTIIGFNFTGTADDVNSNESYVFFERNAYAHNIIVTNCAFTSIDVATAKSGRPAVKGLAQGLETITLVDLQAQNVHSLAQLFDVTNAVIARCNLSASKNGININFGGAASGNNGMATISDSIISPDGSGSYGVRLQGANYGTLRLLDGTYVTADSAIIGGNTAPTAPSYTGSILVEGGFYSGSITRPVDGYNYSITGGYFSEQPNASFIAEGYEVVANTNPETSATYPYTIGVATTYVAQIGDDKYETFAAAIAAAEAYYATNGVYPTIMVLDATTQIGNDDWKIDNSQLVKKVYVAQVATQEAYAKLTAKITEPDANVSLDMWSFWNMQGMVDADDNECPKYVSITDDTMYRDLAVADTDSEAWVSAKYLYDNYLATGKDYNSYQTTYLYNHTASVVTKYETLVDAAAAASKNATITLLANIDEAAVLPYAVTLDKAGFTCGALTAETGYVVINFSGNTDLYRTFMDNWERPDYADLSWYTANPSATSFEIATAAQLAGFAQIVNGKAFNADGTPCEGPVNSNHYAFRNMTVTLTADIDVTAHGWVPIGLDLMSAVNSVYTPNTFRGTFDGGNHTVKIAFSELTSIYKYDALFGSLAYATIKNLVLDISSSYPGDVDYGYWYTDDTVWGGSCGLASYAGASTMISNVTMNGSFTLGTYANSGGSLVFLAWAGAQFYDCVNNTSVSIRQYYRSAATDSYFIWGGMVCQTSSGGSTTPNAKFVRCVNNATVTMENPYDNDRLIGRSATGYGSMNRLAGLGNTQFCSRKLNAGGMVGQVSSSGYLIHVVDCVDNGTIIGCHIEWFDSEGHYSSTAQKGSFYGKEYVGGSSTPVDYTIDVNDKDNLVFYPNDNTYWFLETEDVDLSTCTIKGEGAYYRPSGYGAGTIVQKVGGAEVAITDEETIAMLNESARLVGPVVYNSRVVFQTTPDYVAQIGDAKYETLAAAISASLDGDTIELLKDIQLSGTEAVEINKVGTYTIDGNGFSITPADDSSYIYQRFLFGDSGQSHDPTRNYIVKDLVISGFTNSMYFIRVQGCNVAFNDCAISNNVLHTDSSSTGTRVIIGTFADIVLNGCVIADNVTTYSTMDLNYNANGNGGNNTLAVSNCLFRGNATTGTAMIHVAEGQVIDVSDSTFENNVISGSGNKAVIYHFTSLTGCLFKNNTVSTTTNYGSGGALTGKSGAIMRDCAFVGNTAGYSDAVANNRMAKSFNSWAGDLTITGNYWGDSKPTIHDWSTGDTQYDILQYSGFDETPYAYEPYATSYTLNADNYGVTVVVPEGYSAGEDVDIHGSIGSTSNVVLTATEADYLNSIIASNGCTKTELETALAGMTVEEFKDAALLNIDITEMSSQTYAKPDFNITAIKRFRDSGQQKVKVTVKLDRHGSEVSQPINGVLQLKTSPDGKDGNWRVLSEVEISDDNFSEGSESDFILSAEGADHIFKATVVERPSASNN